MQIKQYYQYVTKVAVAIAILTAEDAFHVTCAIIDIGLHERSRSFAASTSHAPLMLRDELASAMHNVVVLLLAGNLRKTAKFQAERPDFS
jgi:hypothetical protein